MNLLGSQTLPVRCFFCNRFLSGYQELLMKNPSSIDLEAEGLSYCCRSLICTTRQALEEK